MSLLQRLDPVVLEAAPKETDLKHIRHGTQMTVPTTAAQAHPNDVQMTTRRKGPGGAGTSIREWARPDPRTWRCRYMPSSIGEATRAGLSAAARRVWRFLVPSS